MKRLFTLLTVSLAILVQLQAQESVSTDDFTARADFETTCINLGEIEKADETPAFCFKAVNTGNAPLIITYVHASCGCVKLKYPRLPIAPGDTLRITGDLNPGNINEGVFKRDILVQSNADTPRVRLFITGSIIAPERDE